MEETFVKRGRIEIIYEMLSVCLKPTPKTHILYRCNLSFAQIQKYLNFLLSKELLTSVENDDGRVLYKITDKGKEFLNEYVELSNFMD